MPGHKPFIVVILFGLGIFGAPAADARQNCHLPAEIDALIVGMQLTLASAGAVSPKQRAWLTRLSASIDKTKVDEALQKSDLRTSQNAIAGLIDNAQKIAADGYLADRATMLGQLTQAIGLVRTLCAERARRIDQQLQRAETLRQNDVHSSSLRRLTSLPDTAKDSSLLILSLLAPAVLGLVAIMFLALRLYAWIQAFAFTRKACRITAAIEHDLDIIDGHILIIGRRSVMFQPENEAPHNRLEDFDEGEPMNLLVGHHCLAGRVEGIGGNIAAFFFEKPIQNDFIDILLKASTITPRYVRARPPKSKKNRSPKEKKSFLCAT